MMFFKPGMQMTLFTRYAAEAREHFYIHSPLQVGQVMCGSQDGAETDTVYATLHNMCMHVVLFVRRHMLQRITTSIEPCQAR